MRTRIEITDEMVDRYLVSMNTAEWTTRKGVRKSLEAALGDLLERRTSERRKPVELLERIERQMERKCLQVGAYAPEGHWHLRIGDPSATIHRRGRGGQAEYRAGVGWCHARKADGCAVWWHGRATDSKGENGAAPAKPAAVEPANGFAVGGRLYCFDCIDRSDCAKRSEQSGKCPYYYPDRDGPKCADDDAAKAYQALKAIRPSTQSAPTSQDTTRTSASTTAAPEVSSAMLYRGVEAWQTSEMWNLDERVSMVFRAMYLKMLEEQSK